QTRLQRVLARERLFVLVRLGRKMDTPAVRRSFPMKQVRPLVRVGDVVALGIPVLSEIVGDLDVQGAVGIGEALELDPEVLAHDAARAFAAHEVSAAERLRLTDRIRRKRGYAIGILLERSESRAEPHINVGMRL